MTDVKMTKQGLRSQQHLLKQLENYLPTLQLKKTLLMSQSILVRNRILRLIEDFKVTKKEVFDFAILLSSKHEIDLLQYVQIKHIQKTYENIAGVEIPNFENIIFSQNDYGLFDSPIWLDTAVDKLKEMITQKEKITIEEEKKRSIEKELKDVSIRVNLFEKILIPRSKENIKKIKIFLGDQELAAISQAKMAKLKKVK
jgi:V/A-type H+/Na+-transporting ATPase subunit D